MKKLIINSMLCFFLTNTYAQAEKTIQKIDIQAAHLKENGMLIFAKAEGSETVEDITKILIEAGAVRLTFDKTPSTENLMNEMILDRKEFSIRNKEDIKFNIFRKNKDVNIVISNVKDLDCNKIKMATCSK